MTSDFCRLCVLPLCFAQKLCMVKPYKILPIFLSFTKSISCLTRLLDSAKPYWGEVCLHSYCVERQNSETIFILTHNVFKNFKTFRPISYYFFFLKQTVHLTLSPLTLTAQITPSVFRETLVSKKLCLCLYSKLKQISVPYLIFATYHLL